MIPGSRYLMAWNLLDRTCTRRRCGRSMRRALASSRSMTFLSLGEYSTGTSNGSCVLVTK